MTDVKIIIRKSPTSKRCHTARWRLLALLALAAGSVAAAEPQVCIPWVEQMPRFPEPLHVIDWKQTAADYYRLIFDPAARGTNLPAVDVSKDGTSFAFPAYLTPARHHAPDTGEAITCLGAVAGAQLVGLDMHHLHGTNWASDCKRWFEPGAGIFRDHIGQRGGIVSHVVYGYWPLALGLMIGDLNRDDPGYRRALDAQFSFLLRMARDMGCPDHPELKQGYDIATRKLVPVRVDWSPANASCLAWMLYAGYQWTGDHAYLDCAEAALRWQRQHPGRYEIAHVMGPLTVARLNAEDGGDFDLEWAVNNWIGDPDRAGGLDQRWGITHGTRLGGITCDGLDGAWWLRKDGPGFYAFAMGSFQAPAWLLPVARYDPRFARCIGRYALNAASSCRLFLGLDLDGDHQDHLEWRKAMPDGTGFLFSYEGVRSVPHRVDAAHRFSPYATGDPLAIFSHKYTNANVGQYWADKKDFALESQNISLYMGNHVGFLGSVFNATDVPGIIAWDLTRTDYFRPRSFPTFLLYNPYPQQKSVRFDAGPTACDVYDAVSGNFLCRGVKGSQPITLAPDDAVVLVLAPPNASSRRSGSKLLLNDVVVDYRLRQSPTH